MWVGVCALSKIPAPARRFRDVTRLRDSSSALSVGLRLIRAIWIPRERERESDRERSRSSRVRSPRAGHGKANRTVKMVRARAIDAHEAVRKKMVSVLYCNGMSEE